MIQSKEKHVLTLLLDHLERISTDSVCVHRASGARGALPLMVELLERDESVQDFIFEELHWQPFTFSNHLLKKNFCEKSPENTNE